MAEQDMNQANQSYEGFVNLIKWGTIASVVSAAIVILLIAS